MLFDAEPAIYIRVARIFSMFSLKSRPLMLDSGEKAYPVRSSFLAHFAATKPSGSKRRTKMLVEPWQGLKNAAAGCKPQTHAKDSL